MFLYKVEAAVSVMHVEVAVKKFLDKFFKEYNLPMPRIKIVNQLTSRWLGRTSYSPKVDKNNTTIEIQKSVTADEKSLDRVIAHELIHHWDFVTTYGHPEVGAEAWKKMQERHKLGFKDSEHGKEFHEWAAKINAVMGKDYVTEKSDMSYTLELDKEFYSLVLKNSDGKYSYVWTAKPSKEQQELIDLMLRPGVRGEAKLFKTKDERFTHGAKLKKYKPSSVPRDKETQDKLKQMYESGTSITPSWSKLKIAANIK